MRGTLQVGAMTAFITYAMQIRYGISYDDSDVYYGTKSGCCSRSY